MEILIIDEKLTAPSRATEGAAAYDLVASTFNGQHASSFVLEPGQTVMVGTGICLDIGTGLEVMEDEFGRFGLCAMVLPRSGLGCRGIKPANSPGLIDSDYLGEIKVCLVNQSNDQVTIAAYDRIAQLLFVPAFMPILEPVDAFSRKTSRGEGGFGSTGN